jgi:hypothetical protein
VLEASRKVLDKENHPHERNSNTDVDMVGTMHNDSSLKSVISTANDKYETFRNDVHFADKLMIPRQINAELFTPSFDMVNSYRPPAIVKLNDLKTDQKPTKSRVAMRRSKSPVKNSLKLKSANDQFQVDENDRNLDEEIDSLVKRIKSRLQHAHDH